MEISQTIKVCKKIVKEKRVKIVSESNNNILLESDGHNVRFFLRNNKFLIDCDCISSTQSFEKPERTYYNNNSICYHKLSALMFLLDGNFSDRINNLINQYKEYDKLKLPVSLNAFIMDLESIRDKR